jgi:hypothetical protein
LTLFDLSVSCFCCGSTTQYYVAHTAEDSYVHCTVAYVVSTTATALLRTSAVFLVFHRAACINAGSSCSFGCS